MIWIFIKSTKTFSVHDNYINGITFRSKALYGLAPHPHTLGASINGWSNTKAIAPIKKHPIKQIALASSIHASYRNYTYWALEVHEVLPTLFVKLKKFFLFIENDQWNGFLWIILSWTHASMKHLVVISVHHVFRLIDFQKFLE